MLRQTYYERLANIAETIYAEAGSQIEPSGSRAVGALAVLPAASATTAAKKDKPPLPKCRRGATPQQQEQRVPQQLVTHTPSREAAVAPGPISAAAAAPLVAGPRWAEQSCVGAGASDRQHSAKQQGRAEAKLRARVEELQVLLLAGPCLNGKCPHRWASMCALQHMESNCLHRASRLSHGGWLTRGVMHVMRLLF